MKFRFCACALLSVAVVAAGCTGLDLSRPGPPPPGWRSPVADLLLDPTDLPEGWRIDLEFPRTKMLNPAINHVAREWWNPEEGSTGITQSIWRAYTQADARDKYTELRQ